MADKIFVNYRREDAIGTAGRLRDRLAEATQQVVFIVSSSDRDPFQVV